MPLLLIPLAIAAFVALWLVTLPLAVWQRYRRGRARRRAQPWVVGANAWSLLVSALLFLLGAWIAGAWIDRAPAYAAAGLLAGFATGGVGLALTRYEVEPAGLFYTPNRWLVLALTLVVAVRIGYGLWHVLALWSAGESHAHWVQRQGSLLAVGGLLLGYHAAYLWGLRRRLARRAARPRY